LSQENDLSRLDDLVKRALAKGADAADAVLIDAQGLAQAVRLGKPERLERDENREVGLRVLIGRRQAVAATSDLAEDAIEELAERVVAMARAVPEDRFVGLADPEQITRDIPSLDLFDPAAVTPETLLERAQACEEAARAVAGVTNSEGSEASVRISHIALVASNGFAGAYTATSHNLYAAVIAGSGDGMQADYDYTGAVYLSDLRTPEDVGRSAGERAVRKLNPKQMPTKRLPVVYEQRSAGSLLGSLAGAIDGTAIARGTSFLKSKLGEEIFAPGIEIVDDPLRQRGLRSRPFDAEGLPCRPRKVIDQGRLTGWTLDLATARQLGMESTGSASRGTAGGPSPSIANLTLTPGSKSPAELIADIEEGFFVTEMMGRGVNPVTGDYSRGAAGFWIEKGEIAFPVSEMTIASNCLDMFRRIEPANDLVLRSGVDAPTLRIDGMTVAGQ